MEFYLKLIEIAEKIKEDSTASGETYITAKVKKVIKILKLGQNSDKEAIQQSEEALEFCKEIIEEFGKKHWSTKIIKKKKKKKQIKAQLSDAVGAVHKALAIIQTLRLTQSLAPVEEDHSKVILWVDDNPQNNAPEVKTAERTYNLEVIQKTSTEEAVDYLNENIELQLLPSSHFRIITDCFREDEGDDAGKNLIEWLRGEGWETPIVVYTSKALDKMDLHFEYSNTLVIGMQSQLYQYMDSMNDQRINELIENGMNDEGDEEDEGDEVVEENGINNEIDENEENPKLITEEEIDEENIKQNEAEEINEGEIEEEQMKENEEIQSDNDTEEGNESEPEDKQPEEKEEVLENQKPKEKPVKVQIDFEENEEDEEDNAQIKENNEQDNEDDIQKAIRISQELKQKEDEELKKMQDAEDEELQRVLKESEEVEFPPKKKQKIQKMEIIIEDNQDDKDDVKNFEIQEENEPKLVLQSPDKDQKKKKKNFQLELEESEDEDDQLNKKKEIQIQPMEEDKKQEKIKIQNINQKNKILSPQKEEKPQKQEKKKKIVYPNNDPDPRNCEINVDTQNLIIGQVKKLEVILRNQKNQEITELNPEKWSLGVEISGPDDLEIDGFIDFSNENNHYFFTFFPTRSGAYSITGFLNNDPFDVTVINSSQEKVPLFPYVSSKKRKIENISEDEPQQVKFQIPDQHEPPLKKRLIQNEDEEDNDLLQENKKNEIALDYLAPTQNIAEDPEDAMETQLEEEDLLNDSMLEDAKSDSELDFPDKSDDEDALLDQLEKELQEEEQNNDKKENEEEEMVNAATLPVDDEDDSYQLPSSGSVILKGKHNHVDIQPTMPMSDDIQLDNDTLEIDEDDLSSTLPME